MDKILRVFASLKLTLMLIVATVVLASVGTFFPQGEQALEIVDTYGQATYDFLYAVGITDTYQSWWFLLVLGLVFINLAACTIDRLPKVVRMRKRGSEADLADTSIPKTKDFASLVSDLSPGEAAGRIRGVLQADFARMTQLEEGSSILLSAEKQTLALFGAYIVHAGLFLLLIAGGIKLLFGYTEQMIILEGSSEVVPKVETRFGFWLEPWKIPGTGLHLGLPKFYERRPSLENYSVALDTFAIDFYDNGAPSLFRSDIRVTRDDRELSKGSIEVNQPFSFDAKNFYQASYGYHGLRLAEVKVWLPDVKTGKSEEYQVVAPYKKRFKMEDTGWAMEITDFFPEASMESPGKLINVGNQMNNPAIRLAFYKNGELKTHFWTVYSYPGINGSKVKNLRAEIAGLDPVAFTVLQVGFDPGIYLAAAGSVFFTIGVFAAFYMYYRKIWVQLAPRPGGGCSIKVAGLSKRRRMDFERDFPHWIESIQTGTNGTKG